MLSYGSVEEIFENVIRVELELFEVEDSCKGKSEPTIFVDVPDDLFSCAALFGTVKEGDIIIFTHNAGKDICPLVRDDKEKKRRIDLIQSLES